MFPMTELHPITPLGDGDFKYREMLIAVAVCSEQGAGSHCATGRRMLLAAGETDNESLQNLLKENSLQSKQKCWRTLKFVE